MSEGERNERLHHLLLETEEFMMRSPSKENHRHYRSLMERVHRALASDITSN